MITDLDFPLRRVVFQDGQMFASRDLRDSRSGEARLWAMHNRFVHDTWGIAYGLEVTIGPGGLAATVSPGAAIDADGHWIELKSAHAFTSPMYSQEAICILALCDCGCSGWIRQEQYQPGAKIPLVRARIAAGKIVGPVDFGIRRYARRLTRPHIATGVTASGNTGWHDSNPPSRWIEATIDTSSAGFLQKPQYFARLSAGEYPAFIRLAGPTSFRYCVLRGTPPFGIDINPALAEAAQWTISWLGVETDVTGGAS